MTERQFFTRTEPVLLPYYARFVYLSLMSDGYIESEVFDGLGFSAEHLQDEHYRLSIEQHENFILRALELTQDLHYSVHLAEKDQSLSANLPILAMANSGQISKSLHLITRYNWIFTRVFKLELFDHDGQTGMVIEPYLEHEKVIYFALSSFVLFLNNFFRRIVDNHSLIQRVDFQIDKPAGFEAVQQKYGFPIVFNQKANIVQFNSALLDRKMQQADPQTVRLLMEMCEDQLEKAKVEESIVGAVIGLVVDHIASPPQLHVAASMLGFSSRGLRRKLEQSGTTYKTILDSVRQKIATKLLKETNEPVSSVAFELGFDNASDFSRAFKRWTGQSPSSLRKD